MSLGYFEIFLILVVVVLIFGAGRLPKIMKDMAEGINAFKKGMKEGEEKNSEVSSSKPPLKKVSAKPKTPKKAPAKKSPKKKTVRRTTPAHKKTVSGTGKKPPKK